jgi:uncharacterized protein (DUF1330 family)
MRACETSPSIDLGHRALKPLRACLQSRQAFERLAPIQTECLEPRVAAYLIVDTLLDDADMYEQYKLKARPLIEKFGGEYLARGGRMTLRETDLWSPSRLVLVRFSDVETANRCLDSFEYQQILLISKKSARRTAVVLEGE